MLTVAAVLLISHTVLGVISVTKARSTIRESIRQRMLDIANCASGSVNGDVLESLTADSAGTPEYEEVYNALAIFRDNVELEYVYSIKHEGGRRFTFIVDTDPENPGEFGSEVKYTDALRTASTGIAAVDEEPYTDAWGEFYSAYSPVFDSPGKVAGIVAADFAADWYDSQLVSQTRSTLISNIIILVLMLAVSEVLCFLIVRPFAVKQEQLSREVEKKAVEKRELLMEVLQSVADAVDEKDAYTKGHSRRVADYAREIARRNGRDAEKLDEIYMMGLLHDVGKIGIPDSIINKPAALTGREFAYVKRHAAMGERILDNIKSMPKLKEGAKWHHERYGGGGYPDGLVGEEIPEEERIIAVADAYDSMTSNRSYRKPMTQEQVRAELEKGRGTQFDPTFTDIMLQMMDEDKEFKLREKY